MDEERPQHEVQLEDEGIPDHEGPLPEKAQTGDQQEGIIPPGTDPRAADRFGTTAQEQARGEGLADRLSEEVPDDAAGGGDRDEIGQLTQQGDTETDREKTLVADEHTDAAGEPAEELAMREEEDEVPGGYDAPTDGYVDEDRAS